MPNSLSMCKLLGAALISGMMALLSPAAAATVSVAGPSTANPGDAISLTVSVDSGTVSGFGLSVGYNAAQVELSALALGSVFDGLTPGLDFDLNLVGSGADFIALESFLLWDIPAPVSLMTFDFTALPRSGGLASFTVYLTVLDLVDFTEETFELSHEVQIGLPAVPLPAGGVLILSALAGLGGLRLRRKRAL